MMLPDFVQNEMSQLDFVTWDRFTMPSEGHYCVYGWIDREKDSYKDFVLLIVEQGVGGYQITFHTSSSKYSKKISKRLGMDVEDHSDCIRVEYHADLTKINAVRL